MNLEHIIILHNKIYVNSVHQVIHQLVGKQSVNNVLKEHFPIFMDSQVLVLLVITVVIKRKQGKLSVYYVVLVSTKINKVKPNANNVQKEHFKI